jgi:tetratricopeptide (TPR) repeat protein
MTNQFDSKGSEQNIAQGDHAIGKQENATQPVSGDGHIFSGTGNVTVNQGLRVKPRTVLLGAGLGAVLLGTGLAGWYWLAPSPVPNNTISINGNNSGTAVIAPHGNFTVNSGVPPELLAKYSEELGETKQLINTFFGTLLKEKVPRDQWDSKLREIAANYKELLARVGGNQAAKQAIERGDYAKAEQLLEDVAKQQSIAAAKANVDNAKLQEVQLRYAKAATYWQKAAALLPEDQKQGRGYCLHEAGYDLHRVGRNAEALPLYEKSLSLAREIGFKNGEGISLNSISQIYYARGDYTTALKYLEQSLVIFREIGDKAHEGGTLNNIGQIYYAKGDYTTAMPLYEQSLIISRGAGNRAMEGTTLNNIGGFYRARSDYPTALKYLEQSLAIRREIGDKAGEAVTSWNIGVAHKEQGDLSKAEQYISRAVQLMEELGHPQLEDCRKELAAVRAKLRGR